MGRVPRATGCPKVGTSMSGDRDSGRGKKSQALPRAPQSYSGGSSCREISKLPGSCPATSNRKNHAGQGSDVSFLYLKKSFGDLVWGGHTFHGFGEDSFQKESLGQKHMVGRQEGLGGGAAPSGTSGQSALSEAGWGRAAVCTGRGAGGPAGDLAIMADPQHRPGRQGLRSMAVAAGAGRVWPFTGPTGWAPGLAESQPAGPQGGLRPVCWGPGAGWPKHPQGIGQNTRPQANAPAHRLLPEKWESEMHCRVRWNSEQETESYSNPAVRQPRAAGTAGSTPAPEDPAGPPLRAGPGQPCPPSPAGQSRSPCPAPLSRRPGSPQAVTLSRRPETWQGARAQQGLRGAAYLHQATLGAWGPRCRR